MFIRSTRTLTTILNVARNSSNSTTIVQIISIFVSITSSKTRYSIRQPFFLLLFFMILDGFQCSHSNTLLSVNFYWIFVVSSRVFFLTRVCNFCISVKQLAIFHVWRVKCKCAVIASGGWPFYRKYSRISRIHLLRG